MRLKTFGLSLLAGTLAAVAAADSIPVPEGYRPPFDPPGRPLEGLVITVDVGHGGSSFSQGYHGSARGTGSRLVEGDLNMRVAGLVYHHLKGAGATVHMTRRDDRKVTLGPTERAEELGARPAMAEATRSHLFLSLHHNAAPRVTADGVVVLIWPTDKAGAEQPLEKAFADALREEVEKKVHHAEPFPHYLNKHPLVADSDLPSAVVEFGFLSNAEFDAWVANPTAHKDEAIGIYEGVVRMWTDHRTELAALRDKVLGPGEPEAGDSSATPLSPLGNPASAIWPFPRLAETPTDLSAIVRAYRGAYMTDRSTPWLDVQPEWQDGKLVALGGSTNIPRLAEGLAKEVSKCFGREIPNKVATLPAEKLGGDPYGVVQIPMALTWAEPSENGTAQTQVLLGEPLFLLDATPDESYFLVQGIDGYCGWLRADAVKRMPRTDFAALMRTPAARVVRNAMDDDFRIPPASRLVVAETGADTMTAILPVGTTAEIPAASLRLPASPALGRTAVENAMREYLYTPYVFSGRSPIGIDCSGFVGAGWATVGVQLPRDANQQALMGRIVATPWFREAMEPGDILFFLDENGRVSHTGLSMGGLRFVHCSPPEVQITSMDAGDPLYSDGWTKSFAWARRPAE